jgi:hypothetical protein
MLEYTKTILAKVSFDKMLFEKELRKGLCKLEGEEALLLEEWCRERFPDKHLSILGVVSPKVAE